MFVNLFTVAAFVVASLIRQSYGLTCYSCATYDFGNSGFFQGEGAPPRVPKTISDRCCTPDASVATVSCKTKCFYGAYRYLPTISDLGVTVIAGEWRGCADGQPTNLVPNIMSGCTSNQRTQNYGNTKMDMSQWAALVAGGGHRERTRVCVCQTDRCAGTPQDQSLCRNTYTTSSMAGTTPTTSAGTTPSSSSTSGSSTPIHTSVGVSTSTTTTSTSHTGTTGTGSTTSTQTPMPTTSGSDRLRYGVLNAAVVIGGFAMICLTRQQ